MRLLFREGITWLFEQNYGVDVIQVSKSKLIVCILLVWFVLCLRTDELRILQLILSIGH
jgi:hypothetical protein